MRCWYLRRHLCHPRGPIPCQNSRMGIWGGPPAQVLTRKRDGGKPPTLILYLLFMSHVYMIGDGGMGVCEPILGDYP